MTLTAQIQALRPGPETHCPTEMCATPHLHPGGTQSLPLPPAPLPAQPASLPLLTEEGLGGLLATMTLLPGGPSPAQREREDPATLPAAEDE